MFSFPSGLQFSHAEVISQRSLPRDAIYYSPYRSVCAAALSNTIPEQRVRRSFQIAARVSRLEGILTSRSQVLLEDTIRVMIYFDCQKNNIGVKLSEIASLTLYMTMLEY